MMDQIINILDDNEIQSNEHTSRNLKQNDVHPFDRNGAHDKFMNSKEIQKIEEYLKDYTWEELYEWAHQRKLKASRMFNKTRYDEAMQIYVDVLIASDSEISQKESSDENRNRFSTELQVPSLLNIAACLAEKKEYPKAIAVCNQAIKIDPNHYKAYYRRGLSYQNLQKYPNAREDLSRALELCKDEKKAQYIRAAYSKLQDKKLNSPAESALPNQLAVNDGAEIYLSERQDSNSEENTRVLRYNDDLEELNGWGPLKYIAYPVKMSYKFVKNRNGCCRRRKESYVSQS